MTTARLMASTTIGVMNPYTGELIGYVPNLSGADVTQAVELAAGQQEQCRNMCRAKRSQILLEVADRVARDSEEYAQLIVQEAGKTIIQARKEVARCINTLRLSAEEAKRFCGETIPFDAFAGSESRQGYFTRDPLN